jgi:cytochrome c-type biogenesis protein CcmH/NrfG
MTLKTTTSETWTTTQTFAFAAVCLFLGICAGWLLRTAQDHSNPVAVTAATSAPALTTTMPPNPGTAPSASPVQFEQTAGAQVAPLLEQLKSDPTNAGLLAQIGNAYYDAKEYPAAIDYYERSLKFEPSNASVRTDLGTAYWYSGNADTAISEFDKALTYQPNKPDTLFNLGIVKWQGKKDPDGAIAVWQKLLTTNPNYENKAKVQSLIAQAPASLNKRR